MTPPDSGEHTFPDPTGPRCKLCGQFRDMHTTEGWCDYEMAPGDKPGKFTKPDSGERCAWNGYTDNNLSGQCSLRRGHDGPHEIAQPDSGEREVCGAVIARVNGDDVLRCDLRRGHDGAHCVKIGAFGGAREDEVLMSRSLAQRILVLLEGGGKWPEDRDQAVREIRARMSR